MFRGGVRRIPSQPAGSNASKLMGTLGVSVSLDTNSASMPHMYELGFDPLGDKVALAVHRRVSH